MLNKIEMAIDREAMRTGKMGTDTVTVRLNLTDAEKEEFLNLDLSDNYNWEFEGNELTISYTEEI